MNDLFSIKFYSVNFTKNCKQKTELKIVHPKKLILSSFTHPVFPNLYECVCSEHEGRYSEEWGKQSSSGASLTSIVGQTQSYGSQWCSRTTKV